MKKIIAIAFIGMFGAVTLGSCTKVRNCKCITTYTDPAQSSTTDNYPVSGRSKEAKKTCDSKNEQTLDLKTSCTLD